MRAFEQFGMHFFHAGLIFVRRSALPCVRPLSQLDGCETTSRADLRTKRRRRSCVATSLSAILPVDVARDAPPRDHRSDDSSHAIEAHPITDDVPSATKQAAPVSLSRRPRVSAAALFGGSHVDR